jgi:hypothetical protein
MGGLGTRICLNLVPEEHQGEGSVPNPQLLTKTSGGPFMVKQLSGEDSCPE